MVVLGLLVNWLAAALLAFTIVFYVVVYTMWLSADAAEHRHRRRRRRAAADDRLGGGDRRASRSSRSCCSPSSSSGRRRISGRCRSTAPRIMPAPASRCCRWSPAPRETRRQILLYTLLLAPLGVAPWLLGYAGALYGVVALATGAVMIAAGAAACAPSERRRDAASKQLFGFSILYLFLLFAVLLVDQIRAGCSATFGMTIDGRDMA